MTTESEVTHVAEPATTDPRMAILEAFCASDDCRDYLNKPFAVDGVAAACDACIVVFMDGVEAPSVAGVPDGFVKYRSFVTEVLQRDGWVSALRMQIPERQKCCRCDGSGRLIESRCDECDGVGEFKHGSHHYECEHCHGDGVAFTPSNDRALGKPCYDCRGTGKQAVYLPFAGLPRGFAVNASYLEKIQTHLPDAELLAVAGDAPVDVMNAIAIRFAGGSGLLMPARSGR
jgi:hypothetical protein